MVRDQNFKLSKSAKRVLATIQDKNERRIYKELAIQAELAFKSNDWVIFRGNEKE